MHMMIHLCSQVERILIRLRRTSHYYIDDDRHILVTEEYVIVGWVSITAQPIDLLLPYRMLLCLLEMRNHILKVAVSVCCGVKLIDRELQIITAITI